MQTAIATQADEDRDYDKFLERIQVRFWENVDSEKSSLFTTDAAGLFDVYLAELPEANRQYHTCNACRRFIERFGALVTIGEDGRTKSAIWDERDAPLYYLAAVKAMLKIVRKATVTGVFLAKEAEWGTGTTGEWHHFAVMPPQWMLHTSRIETPFQAMAQKREDVGAVGRALGEFTREHVKTALTILKSEAMYRAEKVTGPAQFLADIHEAQANAKGSAARKNVLWRAVAKAPAGFCHPRASMVGTLLDDIEAGLTFDEVSKRFAAKMHPLQYQRPQAHPSAGNIAQAEKLLEQMGLAPSLRRRFARAEEIQAMWRHTDSREPEGSGVFGHLAPKGKAVHALELPPTAITWDKFSRTVLGEAMQMEVDVPSRGNFTALLTACDPEAPPILQWDREDVRNPVSWYLYAGGSMASQWGLQSGWRKVTALTLKPSMWFDPELFTHHGRGAVAIIDGARDQRDSDLCLFPEILKSELHGVRATIEAHSRSKRLEERELATACGLLLSAGTAAFDTRLRVTSKDGTKRVYKIDRWD